MIANCAILFLGFWPRCWQYLIITKYYRISKFQDDFICDEIKKRLLQDSVKATIVED